MGRKLLKVFQDTEMDGGDLLRKFLLEIGELHTMQKSVVWRLLYYGKEPPFSCECGELNEDKYPGRAWKIGRKGENNSQQKMGRKKARSNDV